MDEAVRNGDRVLLAHGTAWLIKAGALDVPLDRANSILEINVAHREADLGTLQRIKNPYYDRIFINSLWYGPRIEGAIQEHYEKVGEIPFGQHPHGGSVGSGASSPPRKSTSKSHECQGSGPPPAAPHLRHGANPVSSQDFVGSLESRNPNVRLSPSVDLCLRLALR